MGYPKFRKYWTDDVYVWDFNTLEPLAPLRSKVNRQSFENISQHPSGFIVNTSSVGSRVNTHPVQSQRFLLQLDVLTEQMYILLSFFKEGAFWFYPDDDIDEGYLVTFSPRDIRPEPTPSVRWIISGELIQIGRDIPPFDDTMEEVLEPYLPIQQQINVISGLSYVHPDNDEYISLFTFEEPESEESDWSALDFHIIRHETNYTDRYERMLFNWVRKVKNIYFMMFRGVSQTFVDKLVKFVSHRKGRFYPSTVPNIDKGTWNNASTYDRGDKVDSNDNSYISLSNNNSMNDPTSSPNQWLLAEEGILVYPPETDYVDVISVENELQVTSESGRFFTSITLEEI